MRIPAPREKPRLIELLFGTYRRRILALALRGGFPTFDA